MSVNAMEVTRRPYQKPEVFEVELIIDDAVLVSGDPYPGGIGPMDGFSVDDF